VICVSRSTLGRLQAHQCLDGCSGRKEVAFK
jgi:hypothetical protein